MVAPQENLRSRPLPFPASWNSELLEPAEFAQKGQRQKDKGSKVRKVKTLHNPQGFVYLVVAAEI